MLARRAPLAALTQAIPQQQSWTDWLRSRLPAPLEGHIVNVIERGAELVVFADSAAWGTRLRYALAGLAAEITQRVPAIRQTRVRIGRG